MKRFIIWYQRLTKQVRASISYSLFGIGLISTLMTILGFSLGTWFASYCVRILIVLGIGIAIFFGTYHYIGVTYKDKIDLVIGTTPVSIVCGNIFNTSGWKVVGCDTHFDTCVDDIVISKSSLHGQLVLNHGSKQDIEDAVEKKARKLNLQKNSNGQYDFELGTVVKYESNIDNETYFMLALTKLDDQYKAYTNMADYEQMLMKMIIILC